MLKKKFPSEDSVGRLRQYGTYERLLEGNHYSAYMGEIGDKFSDKYKALRYMTCNFAGLISKVMADVLFGEKAIIESSEKNTKEQDFIDALVYENNLNTQLYESSLMNSARGDAVLRIRVEDKQIKIEDINPAMYFPTIGKNFRDDPSEKKLVWKEYLNNDKGKQTTYLIEETYTKGVIETNIYEMKGKDEQEVVKRITVKDYNALAGTTYEEKVDTGIEEIPIVHIPNFRVNNNYFGMSDYHDLESLFFAINNRMTSIDNILDKHSDPILAVPEGVLDEKGNVRKEALQMFEFREGEDKPEYIVWNANLDMAFQQIDEIIKTIFLIGEVSPDVVGLDSGKTSAESGRALKLRMLRTLAKKNRKGLYYELGIQKAIEIASMFAKAGNVVGDITYKGDPIIPNVMFADGVVDDKVEEIQNEMLKLESGLSSQKSSIKVVEDFNDEQAMARIKEIKKDKESNADISDEIFHLKARTNDTEGIDKESKTA